MAETQIEIRFIPFVVTKRENGLCHGYVENYNPNFKELQHTDMYVREERCLDLNEFYDICTKGQATNNEIIMSRNRKEVTNANT